MATIPSGTKFIGLSPDYPTIERRSSLINNESEPYTMQDIVDTTRPYKVYTALLTQSGNDDASSTISDVNLTIGVTYRIIDFGGAEGYDFTNVGAPNNNENTYFVATGTTPNSWGTNVALGYVPAAPVVTVLENTLGNVWFTYNGPGNYSIFSDGLFIQNKTTFNISLTGDDISTGYMCLGYVQEPDSCSIVTGNISLALDDVLYWPTPIEIRVYN
jgi:hypothetical protein